MSAAQIPASPAPDRSVRVFTAFLVARAAFGVVYLAATVGRAPIPWYYPLTHRWELTRHPGANAMGWFGLTGLALLAATLFGGLTFLAGGLPVVARAFARRSTVLAIARAGGLVLLVDFVYFGWALSGDERTAWTPPDCSVAPPAPLTPSARAVSPSPSSHPCACPS